MLKRERERERRCHHVSLEDAKKIRHADRIRSLSGPQFSHQKRKERTDMIEESLERIAVALETLVGRSGEELAPPSRSEDVPKAKDAIPKDVPGVGDPDKIFPDIDISREALTMTPQQKAEKKKLEDKAECETIRAFLQEHGMTVNSRLGLKKLKIEKAALEERLASVPPPGTVPSPGSFTSTPPGTFPSVAVPSPAPPIITLEMVVAKVREYHLRFQDNNRTRNILRTIGGSPEPVSSSQVPQENRRNLYTACCNEMGQQS